MFIALYYNLVISHQHNREKHTILVKTKEYIVMYYLIHEKECFIIFKTRGAAERFRYDKTRLFECIK